MRIRVLLTVKFLDYRYLTVVENSLACMKISHLWSIRSQPETAFFSESRSRPEILFRTDFTDVTLAYEDEREELAHRNVLSSTSTKILAQTKYIKTKEWTVLWVRLPLSPKPHLPELLDSFGLTASLYGLTDYRLPAT